MDPVILVVVGWNEHEKVSLCVIFQDFQMVVFNLTSSNLTDRIFTLADHEF